MLETPSTPLQAPTPTKKTATLVPGASRVRVDSSSLAPSRPGIAPKSTASGDESLTHAPRRATRAAFRAASTKQQAPPAKKTASCANLRGPRMALGSASTKPTAPPDRRSATRATRGRLNSTKRSASAPATSSSHAPEGFRTPTSPACDDERDPRQYPWSQSAIPHRTMMTAGTSPCLRCAAADPGRSAIRIPAHNATTPDSPSGRSTARITLLQRSGRPPQ